MMRAGEEPNHGLNNATSTGLFSIEGVALREDDIILKALRHLPSDPFSQLDYGEI